MHPILASARRMGLYLILFVQAGLALGELLVWTASVPRATAMLVTVPPMLVHAFACLASWYLCRRLPLGGTPIARLAANHLAAAVVVSLLITWLGHSWSQVVLRQASAPSGGDLAIRIATLVAGFAFLLYSLATALHYLYIAVEARRAAEGRTYELRLQAREAELRALKSQVDPHFLFNSLNTISALVTTKPQVVRAMCAQLADFLRSSLRNASTRWITLAEEVALAERYLAIERIRFEERLQVSIRVEDGLEHCAVPPLVLQPLIENAIKHGIGQCLEGGLLSIEAARHRGAWRLIVENPCDPDRRRRKGEGIGLDNVSRRLRAAYDGATELDVSEHDQRFQVTMHLPIELVPPDEDEEEG